MLLQFFEMAMFFAAATFFLWVLLAVTAFVPFPSLAEAVGLVVVAVGAVPLATLVCYSCSL